MEMGGKVGIVKKHFPHGGKGGSKCGLKHLDEIQTPTYTCSGGDDTQTSNSRHDAKNVLLISLITDKLP